MAYGVVTKRRIQFGKECSSAGVVAAGTPVASTAIWRGPGAQIDSGNVITRPPENVGLQVDTERTYSPSKMAALDIPQTEATYEQVCYPLEAGVLKIKDGVADGGGASGRIYDYKVDETGGNTVLPFTIEAGDNNDASDMEYGVCTEFTLTWAAKQALMITSKWIGRQRTVGQAFASLTLPTIEEILAPTISITDGGTAIGTTPLAGTLIGYELVFTTGIVPLFTGDGATYFQTIKYTKPTCTLRLTYEHDANASTEYGKFIAQTTRLVRIKHEGTATTAGGTYTKKTFMIDFSGRYTSFPPYADQDGDNIITCELQAGYNVAADLFARFLLVNTLAEVT